jgi:hypothetical protein
MDKDDILLQRGKCCAEHRRLDLEVVSPTSEPGSVISSIFFKLAKIVPTS